MGASLRQVAPKRSSADEQARAARRERLGERLLIAVEALLRDSTYRELTLDSIVAEAGISRRTFYNYFDDKGDLLQVLTGDAMGRIIEATTSWWDLPADASRVEVEQALRHLAQGYAPHAALMLAAADAVPHDIRVREAFLRFMSLGVDGIAGYIVKGQQAGVLRADIDAGRASHWLTWMMERGLSRLGRLEGGYDPDRVARAATDIIWKSLHA